MSVYVTRLRSVLQADSVLNVFTHASASPGTLQGTAEGFARAFDDIVVDALLPITILTMNFVEVDVYDLFFPANIFTLAINKNGVRTGEPMPRFNAASFRTNRATRDIRRGQKRIAGVSEGDQTAGVWSGAYVTALIAAGAIMDDVFVDQFIPSVAYTPVVVKRIFDSTPAPGHYRLPETFAEYQAFTIVSWTPNTLVSSQNTRKNETFLAP